MSGSGKAKVLVAAPLVGDHVRALAAIADVDAVSTPETGLTQDELLVRVEGVDALIPLLTHRIDRALLEAAPKLRVVANHAVGVDNVDLAACHARGVIVTNTPGVLTEATADLAFGLVLDACRRISEGQRVLRSGEFEGWSPRSFLGARVHGATLGIVGFGRIGQAMARRARGFSMRVVYASPRRASHEVEVSLAATYLALDDLLETADIVTLHAPLTDDTRGLLSRERILRMKPGAFLVNAARGPLIDERALAELLQQGHLGGAALDVFVGEPRVDEALLAAPRLVLTPHIGSADVDARDAMARLACESVRDVLEGRPPRHRVT